MSGKSITPLLPIVDLSKLPKALYTGPLTISGITIQSAVVPNDRHGVDRVLTQRTYSAAVGRHLNPNSTKNSIDNLPAFLASKNLKPFISKDLIRSLTPIYFIGTTAGGINPSGGRGGNIWIGYHAETLPQVCNVWVAARDAGVLVPSQLHIAERCYKIIQGLSIVGIVALIDEATGYQRDRESDALRKILEAYISPELLPWQKKFPDEYYKQLCRLYGWSFRVDRPQEGPRFMGKLTNRLIYDRLPEGVLDELRKRNPIVTEGGRRRYHHHNFLTENVGNKHLDRQIIAVVTLMRASDTCTEFDRLFEKLFSTQEPQADSEDSSSAL